MRIEEIKRELLLLNPIRVSSQDKILFIYSCISHNCQYCCSVEIQYMYIYIVKMSKSFNLSLGILFSHITVEEPLFFVILMSASNLWTELMLEVTVVCQHGCFAVLKAFL